MTELGFDEVDELLVVLDTGTADVDLAWGDGFHLEFLEDVGSEVVGVICETSQWHTETLLTEGSSHDVVVEGFTSLDVLVELVGVLVLLNTDRGGDNRAGLESAISHHSEDISSIMGEAVGLPVLGFLVVIHLEAATGHLNHTAEHSRREGHQFHGKVTKR